MGKKARVILDLEPPLADEFERLKELLGLNTQEMVCTALTVLMDWVVKHQNSGRQILAIDHEKKEAEELVIQKGPQEGLPR